MKLLIGKHVLNYSFEGGILELLLLMEHTHTHTEGLST